MLLILNFCQFFDDEGPQLGVGGGLKEEEVEVQGGGAEDRRHR